MGLKLPLIEVCNTHLDSTLQTVRGEPAAPTSTVLIWRAQAKAPGTPIASHWAPEASVLFGSATSRDPSLMCFHISSARNKTKGGRNPRPPMRVGHPQRQRRLGPHEIGELLKLRGDRSMGDFTTPSPTGLVPDSIPELDNVLNPARLQPVGGFVTGEGRMVDSGASAWFGRSGSANSPPR
jgi:hypothetical protein